MQIRLGTRRLFNRQDPHWDGYVEWIGRPELREVRTLDSALNEYIPEWGDRLCEGAPLVERRTIHNRYRAPLFVLCVDTGKDIIMSRLMIASPGPTSLFTQPSWR